MDDKIDFFKIKIVDTDKVIYGNYIFKNKNNAIKKNNIIPSLIYHHIAKGDLNLLEEFLFEKGFIGILQEFVSNPNEITYISINKIPNKCIYIFNEEETRDIFDYELKSKQKVLK